MKSTGVACLVLSLCVVSFVQADDTQELQRFETFVRPVLIERCVRCHGPDKPKSGLRLDSPAGILAGGESGPIVTPKNSKNSLLMEVLDSGQMPPESEPRLSPEQITAIRRWIDAGAILPDGPERQKIFQARRSGDHWAYRAPDRGKALASLPPEIQARMGQPAPLGGPPTTLPADKVHPIDAFIDARLAQQKLSVAPREDKRTLARRAAFDLLGLPPTPEQIEKFVKDASPTAWGALIAELLASPHYGERWGRHWLDVARYADSGGYETDIYYRHAWRYRDYVVKSFNDDKPYNRFVQEQIAGDEIWPSDLDLDGAFAIPAAKKSALEAHTGTGFFALGPQIHESNMDGRRIQYEQLSDWVDTAGAAFMGITLGCARCHDHKFDPFSQQDYFSLQAIFARSRTAERPIVSAMEMADFKQVYPHVIAVAEARDAYRRFDQTLAGRKATPEEETKKRELLLAIAKAVLEIPRQGGSSPNTPYDGLMEVASVTVLEHERPELVKPVFVLGRGELGREKNQVTPGLPVVLATSMKQSTKLSDGLTSRKEFAEWLTRPDHPLIARVIVNRVWQWHFGRGLVSTPNDFGVMGQPPSHPELLDWLATEFVARGWSIKQLHYLIMTSEAYRRESRFAPAEHVAADPTNRWLWRFNRRRLEGEAIWDSIHAVAGTINLQLGGPPVIPPLSGEELSALREKYRWVVSSDTRQHQRRGLYVVSYRNFRFPLFDVFDAPNSAVSTADRDVSSVASQSLWLLNNHTAWEQAQQLAGRIIREKHSQPTEFVTRLWQLALGRAPTEQERKQALDLLERLQAEKSPQRADLPLAEFSKIPPEQATAYITLSLALFNHNEFLFID